MDPAKKSIARSAIIALVLALAGILLVLYAWRLPPFHSPVETTENAYVRADISMISARVEGYVRTLAVEDNQAS